MAVRAADVQGGGAGVEDQAVALPHELARGGGDGALRGPVLRPAVAVVELQHHALRQHGAAVRALQVCAGLEGGKVAPDRHLAHVELAGELGHAHARLRGKTLADAGLAGGGREMLHDGASPGECSILSI